MAGGRGGARERGLFGRARCSSGRQDRQVRGPRSVACAQGNKVEPMGWQGRQPRCPGRPRLDDEIMGPSFGLTSTRWTRPGVFCDRLSRARADGRAEAVGRASKRLGRGRPGGQSSTGGTGGALRCR